jgi:membrane-bound lytic murein transglycosylase MltF
MTLSGCGRGVENEPKNRGNRSNITTENPEPVPSPSEDDPVPIMDVQAAEMLKLNRRWTGDLSGLGERRFIRALVAYNRTTYFVDRGTQRGTAYEALVQFEKKLRAHSANGRLAPKILIIPTSRDRLYRALAAGYGDIAIGEIGVTSERRKIVDFSDPVLDNVSRIVVTGPSAPPITSLDDLSGKEVHVRPSSSYHESLLLLNERFRREGKKPVVISSVDEILEDEDLIQMVDAGIIGITIIYDLLAKFWSQLYDRVTVRDDLKLTSGDQIVWAVRKNAPELKSVVNEFIRTHRVGTKFGNMILKRYLGSVERLRNPGAGDEIERFNGLAGYFRTFGERYGLPWLLIAAQGYQESRLDQNRRSRAGAVGVMQLTPRTAVDVGIPDIRSARNNIHAGAKYMRLMLDTHFKNAPMTRLNKGLFALASYNAGAARVALLRRKAGQMGLDPNRWFNNVEIVAACEIGHETVDYVSNIYKYYTVYRAVAGIRERKPLPRAGTATVTVNRARYAASKAETALTPIFVPSGMASRSTW